MSRIPCLNVGFVLKLTVLYFIEINNTETFLKFSELKTPFYDSINSENILNKRFIRSFRKG
ncbi:hypothetical protein GS511_16315 [Leptospira borgpetersenii]|nr:hypothetical protein GS524_16320 [Leptospira borgpetersenii]QHE31655.1 hypothetical protein GS523_16315 [Leptospira borgpetersenii]QHE34957.1 hypothetical protein GS517_16315 [Leptospira borgpetersenii]QHE38189.1 hypothetical protein GS510_15960 [Leptospira borgpetersenii]QHE38711.1 hypothetical protein GS527_00200 [Leptospira borgpetersenii]